ncbi:MAG: transcription elongation factor GreA [Firmicutes bacterium]|nr:transcription elongation factor GreA [Bacillota bacterium]
MSQQLLTVEDIKELETELEHLKVVGRADMAEKIRTAREFGDLSENAEYDIAKEDQAKMEARILEIENMLSNAVIYEKSTKSDVVNLGSTVTVLNIKEKKEASYEIVGSHQANPFEKRISFESPLGKELMGKKKGDEVTVRLKNGDVKYKVVKIS